MVWTPPSALSERASSGQSQWESERPMSSGLSQASFTMQRATSGENTAARLGRAVQPSHSTTVEPSGPFAQVALGQADPFSRTSVAVALL
jgi:hypothetical protein